MIATSNRINLRFHNPCDIKPIFDEYTSDIQSTKYLARNPHAKLEQTKKMLEMLSKSSSLEEYKRCIWIISLIKTKQPIGYITLLEQDSRMEIHFGIGKPHTGKGYASEAIYLASKYIISESLAKGVSSYTDKKNILAHSALEKAHFDCIGESLGYYTAPFLGKKKSDVFHYKFNPINSSK